MLVPGVGIAGVLGVVALLWGVAPVSPAQFGGLALLAASVLVVMELTRGRSPRRPPAQEPA